jgi:hypothetical protein
VNRDPGAGALPVKSADLPASAFPLTVEVLDAETREVVWSATADGPGAMRIPGPDELGPRPKAARVTYADGTVQESGRP